MLFCVVNKIVLEKSLTSEFCSVNLSKLLETNHNFYLIQKCNEKVEKAHHVHIYLLFWKWDCHKKIN